MRVGANILLLDGFCYQSYNWKKIRPLGELQKVIDSLEEYQCDEISIIRPVRDNDTRKMIEKDFNIIKNINCMTPLSVGGGLRDKSTLSLLEGLPIERLIFSSAFIERNIELINFASNIFGHQAIQCLLPFKIKSNELMFFHSKCDHFIPHKSIDFDLINKLANEVILLDTENEGLSNKFTNQVLNYIPIDNQKIVISGGVGKSEVKFGIKSKLASVLIENKVLHREFSIKGYKNV